MNANRFFFLGGWTHLFATFSAKLFCTFFLSFLFSFVSFFCESKMRCEMFHENISWQLKDFLANYDNKVKCLTFFSFCLCMSVFGVQLVMKGDFEKKKQTNRNSYIDALSFFTWKFNLKSFKIYFETYRFNKNGEQKLLKKKM